MELRFFRKSVTLYMLLYTYVECQQKIQQNHSVLRNYQISCLFWTYPVRLHED